MILLQIIMNEDIRQKLISEFFKHTYYCTHHPEQVANLIITNDESENRRLICASCVGDNILQIETKNQSASTPLKYAVVQIHQTCNTLLTSLPTCAFVDHHVNLIHMLAKNHCKSFEIILQASITNFFQKIRDLLNGRYFQQFYVIISSLNEINCQSKTSKKQTQTISLIKRLVDYVSSFQQLCCSYEEYANLSSEDKLSGKSIILQIKTQVSQIYKEMKEKAIVHNKSTLDQQNILELFNPTVEYSKHFRFSSTLLHYSLKLVDSKKIKIIDLPDNEFTLLALIQPSIGHKKKTIKFRMEGIKGWVAVGIAIRSTVEHNSFKFESGLQHGTFQTSYDGYSWTDDSATNQQYTSWSYNEGDTVTLTVNPSTSQLTYIRNDQSSAPFVLKYKSEKKDKLYFCASVNYNQDSVAIIE